jgi:hypothetical protein
MASVADMIKNGRKQAEQPATPPATPVVEQPVTQPQQQAESQEKVEFTPAPPVISEAKKEEYNEAMHPKKGYEFIFDQIKGSNDANAAIKNEELRKRQQRRDNRGKLFRTLGDGIAAMSNLYFATKGAPSVTYDPKGSLSARAVERWDKMEALRREEEQKQYMLDMRKRELDFKKAQEERLTKKMQNDANYQGGSLALRGAAEEGRNWRTRFTEEAKNQRQENNIENQNKRAEESNKTKVQVAQTNAQAKVDAAEVSAKKAAGRFAKKPKTTTRKPLTGVE